MIGEFPGLAKLDKDGNLRATSDFRGALRRAVRRLVRRRPGRGPARRARHREAGDPQVIALAALRLALAAPAAGAARVLVEATEFRFTLSRTTVKAGPAIVQLAIRGEDPHDLQAVAPARPARERRRRVPETLPGGVAEWRGKLTRGQLDALLLARRATRRAGMRTALTVK